MAASIALGEVSVEVPLACYVTDTDRQGSVEDEQISKHRITGLRPTQATISARILATGDPINIVEHFDKMLAS
jgi:hypothetical protein